MWTKRLGEGDKVIVGEKDSSKRSFENNISTCYTYYGTKKPQTGNNEVLKIKAMKMERALLNGVAIFLWQMQMKTLSNLLDAHNTIK